MAFLESPRFPDDIAYGSSGGPSYQTQVIVTRSGRESRNIDWEAPLHRYDVGYGVKTLADLETLLAFFHAMIGRANGFRFRDPHDHLSCAYGGTPAADDQTLGAGDGVATTFALRKIYAQGSLSLSRLVTKPVSGTVLVMVNSLAHTTRWTLNTTTGIVTFSADITGSITDGTRGTATILTKTTHGLTTGDTVHLSTFTGTWTPLNGHRYAVTKTGDNTFSVPVDSSGWDAYAANGGLFHTLPQTGEAVTAGFEFDVPVRFDADSLSTRIDAYRAGQAEVPLVEIRV